AGRIGMLSRLQRFAIRLHPARHFLLVIALLALGGTGWFLVTSSSRADDLYFIPLVALFAWALMLYAFAVLFVRVPAAPEPGSGFGMRTTVRLQRAGYWLLAVAMLMVSAFLLIATWQLATAWRLAS